MVKNLLKTNPEKIIFASSMTVYSNGGINLKEDQVSKKLSGYPNYKRQSEKIIEKSGIKNTILRFPGLFGGDRKTGIIYNSAYSLLKNQNLNLPSSPIIWAALNIEDAAELVSRAINSEPLGVINAGTDDIFSTSILIQKLALVIKKEIKYQLPFAPEFSMNIDKLRDSIGLPNKSFNQRLEELVINIKKVI